MMSALEGEGGFGRGDVVREVVSMLYYKSDPNSEKREGVKNFADIISGSSPVSL